MIFIKTEEKLQNFYNFLIIFTKYKFYFREKQTLSFIPRHANYQQVTVFHTTYPKTKMIISGGNALLKRLEELKAYLLKQTYPQYS